MAKDFPELMNGKTVMYVHGFLSSAQTHTVEVLRQMLPNARVVAEDLPVHPGEAMDLLGDTCARENPDLIIGTSMGGMFTEMLYGYDRIVINPAFEMGRTMKEHGMIGKQTFQNPRRDGVQEFIVTKQLMKEYEEVTHRCFSGVTDDEKKRVYGLFGDEDPLVHTFDMFYSYYPQAIRFHGAHRLTEIVAHRYLLPVIRWIDDKQTGKERPVVYVSYETMVNDGGEAVASAAKAFKYLLEYYNVFVVADALTNEHDDMARTAVNVEKYINVPAWNRVVYTNHPELLYGDYMITKRNLKNDMASIIKFGSDEFKTWDDIIVYFSRLGGQ